MGYLKNPSPWERGKLNSRNSRRFIYEIGEEIHFLHFLLFEREGRSEYAGSFARAKGGTAWWILLFLRPFAISKGKGAGSAFWNVTKPWKRPYSESRRDQLVRGGGFTRSIRGPAQAGACGFQAKPIWEAVWSQKTAGAQVEKPGSWGVTERRALRDVTDRLAKPLLCLCSVWLMLFNSDS